MLVFDETLLGDYLDGTPAAERFLRDREDDIWAVPSVALSHTSMAALHGNVGGDPARIRRAVTTSMRVLDVTVRTAEEAARLQADLLERGVPADHPDALIAASAREHGATFATADRHFWLDDVEEVLSVARYDPD